MKATGGELPTGDGWAFEIKWDGMRLVASIDPGSDPPVRLTSSTGKDATARFPELQALVDATGGLPAVLDGEAIVLDETGRSDFGRLQSRMHVEGAAAAPVRIMLFDVLAVDGRDTTPLPFSERHRLLTELVDEGPWWSVPAVHHGDGAELLDAARERGLEGLVAKRRDSRYEPGRRSRAWRKVKIRRRQELVVGGWTAGTGGRSTTLGALLVGHHDDTGLRYCGRVGTGFDQRELTRLHGQLTARPRDTSPFVDLPSALAGRAHHVEPDLVVEVEFAEWTADGLLRHPAYAGQRLDVDPARVVREPHPADR
jgi:bifunctional non-homologous end joining protein LigD